MYPNFYSEIPIERRFQNVNFNKIRLSPFHFPQLEYVLWENQYIFPYWRKFLLLNVQLGIVKSDLHSSVCIDMLFIAGAFYSMKKPEFEFVFQNSYE